MPYPPAALLRVLVALAGVATLVNTGQPITELF